MTKTRTFWQVYWVSEEHLEVKWTDETKTQLEDVEVCTEFDHYEDAMKFFDSKEHGYVVSNTHTSWEIARK